MPDKKIVSIEERIPQLKEARKKKANRRLLFYLSLFFLLICIIVYLQSSLSDVKQIQVAGNKHVTSEEITKLSGITTEDNIWKVDLDKAKQLLLKHPEIKNVKIEKHFPNTIKIGVSEYQRIGYVKSNDSYYPIIESGQKLLSYQLKSPKGDAPVLLDFQNGIYLEEMSKELTSLPKSISNLISEIHWAPTKQNPFKIFLYMTDGHEVESSIRNFANNMRSYPSIAAQIGHDQKGIIHIDVGAYFEAINQHSQNTNEEGTTNESNR